MYERIIAGTDFSDTARTATERAARLADLVGAELHVLHAGRNGSQGIERLAGEYGATPHVVSGNPADALIDVAEQIDAGLIVVGSVGMTGARRFLIGNVPNKVTHHATRDVLVVKTDPVPREMKNYCRIVVGTDGSPSAMRAVDAACSLAARVGAAVDIVCAYDPLSENELRELRADPGDVMAQWSLSREARAIPEEFRWRISEAAHAKDVLERAGERAERHGAQARLKALQGRPADAIVDLLATGDYDLVAVGSVGMTGARRFTLGNVPNRVSHHSPVDVLILHTT
ncbi:MAG TPA: universal stress protein [Actinomycetota bacterium]|jgi:nucleotide-binding universal stress UspA family protein|nr:universal stress protein [Actinomycetota bacterium]